MATGFAADIRPLFREKDVTEMKDNGLDLSSYNEVRARARSIHHALAAGDMPCDGRWDEGKLARFQAWMDEGMQP